MTDLDCARLGSASDALRLNPRFLTPLRSEPGPAWLDAWPPEGTTTLALDRLTATEMDFLRTAVPPPASCSSAREDSVQLHGSIEQLACLIASWQDRTAPAAQLGRVLDTTLRAIRCRVDRVSVAHGRVLDLSGGTVIMGVLNTTPDSFSDGGCFLDPDRATDHARHMVETGAAIIDIGGESTRPGARAVSASEEMRRILPVVERLREQTDALLSIDTSRAATARAALEAGAHLVNDVTALQGDPGLGKVVAEAGAGLVLMHMLGTPRTMQIHPTYDDVVAEVLNALRQALARAEACGVNLDRTLVDPGIGFGKTLAHNLALIRNLPVLRSLGRPRVLGVSRKSFLGQLTGETDPLRRSPGSIAMAALAAAQGVEVIRVHDVAETVQAVRVAEAVVRDPATNRSFSGEEA